MDKPQVAEDLMRQPPNGYFVVIDPRVEESEFIGLHAIGRVIARSWRLLLIGMAAGALIAMSVALLMRPMFRVHVLIAQANQQNAAGGALRGQLGGLAALAGIDIGINGDNKEQAVATLNSDGFAREFIEEENLLPVLYSDRWDSKAKRWRGDKEIPRIEDAVKLFTEDVRTIDEDHKTGLVTLTVEWYSPGLAAEWANRMVDRVNDHLRADARRTAERSIEYLNNELAKSNVLELRQAIYTLIQEQVKNAMLANVRREYAFKVIDPAVPPIRRTSPKRMLITLSGAVVGAFVALTFILLRTNANAEPDKSPARVPRET